jgi:hypothetical protein
MFFHLNGSELFAPHLAFAKTLKNIFRKELQHMLFNRRKAEIEILSTLSAARDDQPMQGGRKPAGILKISKNRDHTTIAADMSCSGSMDELLSREGNLVHTFSRESLGTQSHTFYLCDHLRRS